MISFKGRHIEKELILQTVRGYLAYPLRYRNLEEMMKERGYPVDHSTLNRWVILSMFCLQLSAINRQRYSLFHDLLVGMVSRI